MPQVAIRENDKCRALNTKETSGRRFIEGFEWPQAAYNLKVSRALIWICSDSGPLFVRSRNV